MRIPLKKRPMHPKDKIEAEPPVGCFSFPNQGEPPVGGEAASPSSALI
jgi:hypothetical protein